MKLKLSIITAIVLMLFTDTASVSARPQTPSGPATCFVAPGTFQSGHDSSSDLNPSAVTIRLSLVGDQMEFHPGERIPIRLDISSSAAGYTANMDPLGRNSIFSRDIIYIEKEDGVVDPAPDYYRDALAQGVTYNGPGPRIVTLTATSVSATGDLNTWLRFTKPGTYRLYMATSRVVSGDIDPGWFPFQSDSKVKTYSIISNILAVKVVPDDPVWVDSTIAKAKTELGGPSDSDGIATLRYLGTPEALKILIDNFAHFKLWDYCNSSAYVQSRFAVFEAQDRPAAFAELEKCIADPKYPVRDDILWLTAALKDLIDNASSPYLSDSIHDERMPETHAAFMKETARYVGAKTGEAKAVTLYTLLIDAEYAKERRDPGAADECHRYAAEIAADFGELPDAEMDSLLTPDMGGWADLMQQGIVPSIKSILRSNTASTDLRSVACARLLELDPPAGRAAILADMAEPSPKLDVQTLESLPQSTLPGLDATFAKRLGTAQDPNSESLYIGLIERYGTAAILPEMKAFSESNRNYWSYDMQSNLLAYFLRVAPDYGLTELKIWLSKQSNSEYYKFLFTGVGQLRPCEPLRQLAIESLTDSRVDVQMDAVRFLGTYGDNDAVFRARLAQWNANQKPFTGTSSSGRYVFSPGDIGYAIVDSMTRNPTVPYDNDRLVALEPLCVTQSEQLALKEVIMEQDDAFPHVYYSSPEGWQFCQYRSLTLDQVERLVTQCRTHKQLTIASRGFNDPQFSTQAEQLLQYLTKRGVDAKLDP